MSGEVLPYYNAERRFPIKHVMNNWIKHTPNNDRISKLSIPGSHDSGTYSCGKDKCFQFCFSSQCQIWSVYDQL